MRDKGIALIIALATVLVVSGIGTLLFLRTLGEIRHSGQDQAIVQTLLLARGAANVGGTFLSTKAREQLNAIVRQRASTTNCWAFGGNANCQPGQQPDPAVVAQELSTVASSLQGEVDALLCPNGSPRNMAPDVTSAVVALRIHFTATACGQNLPPGSRLPPGRFVDGNPRSAAATGVSQTYALPFVMVAQATMGPYRRNVVLHGEYRFTVGRASFSRWALFTHIHTLPDGTDVWFTDRTLFDGPVHTNSHFRFYRRPWFGGEVTSAGCTNPGDSACSGQTRPGAYFYGVNNGNLVLATNMQPSANAPSYTNAYGTHAPEFTAGVDWGSAFIPLPQNNQAQKTAAQTAGLYFQRTIRNLTLERKCVDGPTNQEVSCSSPLPTGVVKYQYISVTYCTNASCSRTQSDTYRYGPDGKLYQRVVQGNVVSWQPVQRNGSDVYFNGVIFTDGEIQSLSGPARANASDPNSAGPALAEFAKITVAASSTIKITGDLKYENPPCTGTPVRNPDGTVTPATCDNLAAQNMLGVYSQDGDVLISENAPRDLHLHGSFMSAKGVVQVENYDSTPEKGSVFLIGGIIEKYYGAFGTFNARTGQNSTGYGRAFTYDRRFLQGLAPPYFPTTGLDEVINVVAFSYGQREQVY